MFGKPLDQVTESDLQLLIAQTPEKRTLDYKEVLPSNSDADKKDFLADVSSFANASGGYLIYGVAADDDANYTLVGLAGINTDDEILRLEQSALQGIEPRIAGLHSHPVKLRNGNTVIIMQIPRSWAMPHRVTFKEWDKFWSRRSVGKLRLDIGELRSAFIQSATTMQQVRSFREERLAQILAGDTPIGATPGIHLILHVVPLNAFDPSIRFDLSPYENKRNAVHLTPMASNDYNRAFNYEGFITYRTHAYTQIFRSGIVEAVRFYDAPQSPGTTTMTGNDTEKNVVQVLGERILPLQQDLGVELPSVIMLTLTGIDGVILVPTNAHNLSLSTRTPIKRDVLILPNVLIETYSANIPTVMRPAFDVMWNASGWPCSPSYDGDGKWTEPANAWR